VALEDCVLAALEMSDHVVLVATPELASMHDTRQMIELATRVLHIPAGRVHTVLNHRSPDSLLTRKVVEEVLGQPLTAEFRYFGAHPEMAGLEGRLQVQSDPGGHFSRSVRAIIDRVGGAPAEKKRSGLAAGSRPSAGPRPGAWPHPTLPISWGGWHWFSPSPVSWGGGIGFRAARFMGRVALVFAVPVS